MLDARKSGIGLMKMAHITFIGNKSMSHGITRDQHWETLPTNREKVILWLQSIHADEKETEEVIKLCEVDKDARKFFIKLYEEDICR